MDDGQVLREFFDNRIRFCREQRLAYRYWLSCLSPLKWITVGGSVVLSGAASITILKGNDEWELASAAMAAAAGILTALHSNLRCDSYQAECQRIIQMFQSIELAYEIAKTCTASELVEKRDVIEKRLAKLVESAGATPSERARRRAAKHLKSQSI